MVLNRKIYGVQVLLYQKACSQVNHLQCIIIQTNIPMKVTTEANAVNSAFEQITF